MSSTRKSSNQQQHASKKKEKSVLAPKEDTYIFKVLVIGDSGCGKTSIIKRYVHNHYSPMYKTTIGVDFALKVLHWNASTLVNLQLWDIAGQERYNNMTRVYYRDAVAALIVYDTTRQETFDNIEYWKKEVDKQVFIPGTQEPIPCVLIGNKCDLQQNFVLPENVTSMDDYVKLHNFEKYFDTSAKLDKGIQDAINCIVEKCLENHIKHVKRHIAKNEEFNEGSVTLIDDIPRREDTSEPNAAPSKFPCC